MRPPTPIDTAGVQRVDRDTGARSLPGHLRQLGPQLVDEEAFRHQHDRLSAVEAGEVARGVSEHVDRRRGRAPGFLDERLGLGLDSFLDVLAAALLRAGDRL